MTVYFYIDKIYNIMRPSLVMHNFQGGSRPSSKGPGRRNLCKQVLLKKTRTHWSICLTCAQLYKVVIEVAFVY